ncbi:methyltransferase domain-containing protein [Nitrospinota bacterium]
MKSGERSTNSDLMNAAMRHHQEGNLQGAELLYRQVLERNPSNAEALHFLGVLICQVGHGDQGIELMTKSVEMQPSNATFHNNLGLVLSERGEMDKALACYLEAIRLNPDSSEALSGIVFILKTVELSSYEASFTEVLEACFSSSLVDYQDLARVTVNQIKLSHHFRGYFRSTRKIDRKFIEEISSVNLLLSYLEKTINKDGEFEILLTELRRELLFLVPDSPRILDESGKLVSALAQQCFNNEYVFCAEDNEIELQNELKNRIERKWDLDRSMSDELERDLLLFSMYAPLYELSCCPELSRVGLDEWSPPLRPITKRTLHEPLKETELKERIQSITRIDDSTSLSVQSQYEENPYPRWFSIHIPKKVSFAGQLKWDFPHFELPAFFDGPIRILVAGCGTGAEPIDCALRYENVDVVAVDLSRSSLAYAMRMSEELGLENIQFFQGDILNLENLDPGFHVIYCSGVLVAMEQPVEGWKILTGLLVPGGMMRIGLYSEKARASVVRGREMIQQRGLKPDREDIRSFRGEILRQAEGEELSDLLRADSDFFTLSSCRDLLFHVKENRFTLPQIKRILAEQRLTFVGFDVRGTMARTYQQHFPADQNMTDLDSWNEFEKKFPDSFVEMYQFWCQQSYNSYKR